MLWTDRREGLEVSFGRQWCLVQSTARAREYCGCIGIGGHPASIMEEWILQWYTLGGFLTGSQFHSLMPCPFYLHISGSGAMAQAEVQVDSIGQHPGLKAEAA